MVDYTPLLGYLFVLGRILFGGFFAYNGINHIVRNEAMAGYAASRGVPLPKLAVYVSGLMILLGGLGVIIGDYTDIALTLLAVFLVVVTFKMHSFWKDQDPNMKMANQINFYKNLALLGAVLMLFAMSTPWILPLF